MRWHGRCGGLQAIRHTTTQQTHDAAAQEVALEAELERLQVTSSHQLSEHADGSTLLFCTPLARGVASMGYTTPPAASACMTGSTGVVVCQAALETATHDAQSGARRAKSAEEQARGVMGEASEVQPWEKKTLGLGTARQKNRPLKDGQISIPNFVRVADGTGYHRGEGNRRASRNGPVSDLPPEIPRVTIRNFCIAVYDVRTHASAGMIVDRETASVESAISEPTREPRSQNVKSIGCCRA
jgi:hypothetical protein